MFGENRFSVLDANNKTLKENDNRHVLIKDKETFKLKFYNNYNVRTQIDVYMNGKVGDDKALIGSWILKEGQAAIIETNKNSGQLFTFLKMNSLEFFSEIEAYVKEEANWGLVSVRFRTENDYNSEVKRGFSKENKLESTRSKGISYDAGGIALSGSSDQEFGTTHAITSWGPIDTIYAIRLVENKINSLYSKAIPEYKYPV